MITVIFPTRNRAELLREALTSLTQQSLPKEKFEIIVVDNGSVDHTTDVVASYSDCLGNLRYFYEPLPGLHLGRHMGLKEASNELIVFADDDIRATPTWLESITENFVDPTVAMVGGNNFPDFQTTVPAWLEKMWAKPNLGGQGISYLSVLSLSEGRREISPYLVWGCNFSIRKHVVFDAGGFHPDGLPQELIRFRGDGETHISRYVVENNLKCVFDSRASVYHAVTPERMTFNYFYQRAFNQGISDSYTKLRNDPQPQRLPLLNPLKFARRLVSSTKQRLIRRVKTSTDKEDLDLQQLAKTIDNGYQEGFAYHQKIYRKDPEVKTWVHKSDYF